MPGEQVEAYAAGKNASLLVATDKRVIIVRRGSLLGRWSVASFGYGKITSVERFNNLWGPFVQINATGVPGRQVANTFPLAPSVGGAADRTVAAIQRHLYA